MQAGLQQIMRAGMHVEGKQWCMLTYADVCSRMLQQMTRAGMPVEAKQQRRRRGTQDLDADTPRDPRKVTRKARRSDKLRLRELLKEMRVPLHAREAT